MIFMYANIPNSCPEIVWVLSTTLLDEQRQHCPWHDMNHEILVGSASRILKDGIWKKSHYDWVLFHPPLKNNQPWGFVVHERFFFLSFAVSMPDRCSPWRGLLHRKMRRGDWRLGWSKKTVNKMFVRSFFCCPGVSGAIDQGLGRFVLVPHEWTALAILLTFGENYTPPQKIQRMITKNDGMEKCSSFHKWQYLVFMLNFWGVVSLLDPKEHLFYVICNNRRCLVLFLLTDWITW